MQIFTNNLWNDGTILPLVSVITPVYNRKKVVKRTIDSVLSQTFTNIEYIIVDDGSDNEEQIDDLIFSLFETVNIPMMFIKKENGGVHTARNAGFSAARGNFSFLLDSDDEMVPDTIQKCLDVWNSISDKTGYREVVGRCCKENGTPIGNPFIEGINNLPFPQAHAECRKAGGEHYAMLLTSVMKENPFPEYPGVTFLTEKILWDKLASMGFKSYYFNDIIRIYHTESTDSYSFKKKKKKQNIINAYYESNYFLNNWNYYNYGLKSRFLYNCRRAMMARIKGKSFETIKLTKIFDIVASVILFLPSIPAAMLYRWKECDF